MPVCGNYLFFELPKKIVLNPKDGASRMLSCGTTARNHRRRSHSFLYIYYQMVKFL